MRISELAQRTGVSAHRLRRHEALGLIRAERTAGGYREFSERSLREVIFIAMSRDLGFSLKALADTLPRCRAGTLTIAEMIDTMHRRIAEVDAVIAEQRALRRRLVEHTRDAVLAMPMAKTLQLAFRHIAPGAVEIEIPVSDGFSFRPGQLQATAIFAAADFAAVAAAGSLLETGWANATIDTTLKIVGPARGKALRARGRVIDAGRLLTVCAADVYAVDADEQETLCATLLGTARNVPPRA